MSYYVFFFFSSRRRHTRFDCDWSSDVCSSDLDFRWTVAHSQKTGGMEVARLEYARYGRHHFFQFDRHQGQHYAIYTAGNDGNVEEHFPGTWERQALYFAGWAARVDAEAREGRVPRSP